MKFTDLEKSCVYLNPDEFNCWRVAIKSILIDEQNDREYYLTKECRAEFIGINPFDHPAKSELCVIVDSHYNRWNIRDIPIFKFNEYGNHFYQIKNNKKDEIYIRKSEYKLLKFDEIIKHLHQRSSENLYTKFSYKYQNRNFIIFNKVEYINFKGKKNNGKEYLQPIYGYVPFLKDEKINIGYVVKYLDEQNEGNLELRLRNNQDVKNYLSLENGLLKKVIKKSILFILSFIKISEFCEKISIENSKIEFYEKL